eukprot:CAMPEP_0172576440 /NCGR_PEP_ID=MMETSP1067-20121228/137726_1 /TAXON_ID=265564 ORGANISM="Thalassiosira punctigera, Strain Tpunct2005C2" /NCGR_SAMPLE_ID=MMETSP1067 /ASSEMBLY_ACC=CAM_ASM_000444 /LENGTH=655 /DNA_ID=CAMNT_0013369111 /DNA_START=103 /DNA_END=2070 /DNA_ORIENTATION=-
MIVPALLLLNQLDVASGVRPVFPYFSPAASQEAAEEHAYTKYEKYPPYCSTPDEMETRAVPPLGDIGGVSSQLVHVTALIRHGARTPFAGAPSYQCWEGYWEDEETGVWDCDLKTYISPPAVTKEKGQAADGEGVLDEDPDFLFEKRYDALLVSPGKTGNNLNGTCQMGQLLTRGYDQELKNGLHLRQAYFYDGKTTDAHAASDARMRLWDLSNEGIGGRRAGSGPTIGDPAKRIYQEPNLRYRADDEQRTLMSGQILLRGVFEPELETTEDDEAAVIRLHTADSHFDILEINRHICPRANDLHDEAYASDEYKNWVDNSVEIQTVKTFLKDQLGLDEMPMAMFDCMMTTICTDRSLPSSLNDYDGSLGPTPYEESQENAGDATAMFERVANVAIKNFTFPYKYNNAAYAKLGMGPLWKEIMANILPIVDSANNPSSGTPPPKLALFSGHDTTLMPILATLGDEVWSGTDWAPYASMLQIEIHEITDSGGGSDFPSGYAFRLIYNGAVLTDKMDGCAADSELCDSQVLAKQVMPFAKYQERDCASTMSAAPHGSPGDGMVKEMKNATEELIAAPGGLWVIVALVFSSMFFGCMLTICLVKRLTRKTHVYRRDSSALGGFSMRVMDNDEVADSPGVESAVSANYGSTHKDDENTLI